MIALQGTADWPSEHFEQVWSEVAAAAPTGAFTGQFCAQVPVITAPQWFGPLADSWLLVRGRLEQRTPMGAIHADGEEWFVRPGDGAPLAVYVMGAPHADLGTRVELLGRSVGIIRLKNRSGDMQEYPAVIARPLEPAAAQQLQPTGSVDRGEFSLGGAVIVAALVLIAGWVAVRALSKRASSNGLSQIHAVAARAREAGPTT